jgi:hypothetical protein
VKTSGPIVFLEATNDNQDLHVVIALAGHEISAVTGLFFNETQVVTSSMSDGVETTPISSTAPDYSTDARVTAHFGTDDQAADSELVARTGFTTNHRLRGIAYIYARYTFDEDVFATGIPNLSCTVQGKKLFDPRDDTTAFSQNPALAIRDYLTNTTYGLGASADEIDDDSFIAAANVCDETVTTLDGTEPRYTINGVVDTSKAPRAILQDMLTSCGGQLSYSNGKFKLLAGEFRTATKTLDEDDLRGGITIQTKNTGQDQFNAVKGVFVNPQQNFQPTDFPSVTSSTFEAEDNNERRFLDLTLPFTTSVATAQRLAKQALFRSREQITLNMPCNLNAFDIDVGDTVQVTNARLGFDAKNFECVRWNFVFEDNGQVMGVDLTLRETSAAAYEFDPNVDETIFASNNTNLPNPADIPAPGLSVTDELRVVNEEAISVLIANVTGGSAFTNTFEVEAKELPSGEFVNLGRASGNRFELLNVVDGADYEVRARAVTTFGFKSAFSTVTHNVIGKTEPPQDVTNFTGNVVSGALALSWTPVPDLDLSHYRLRFASATSGATYQNAVNLIEKIPRPGNTAIVPARSGTYFLKAVDKLGLASENPATIVVTTSVADVEDLNVIQTINEHPDFTGAKDDVVVLTDENALILDTSINFDDKTGNFDDAGGLFDGGGGFVDLEGFYNFATTVDLGAKFTSRVTASMSVTRQDYVNTFDEATGLFDSRDGNFDGDVNAFDETDAELQVRTTDDDPNVSPTYTDFRPFVVGDYTARALQFRLRMTTTDTQATPKVEEVTVTVDMPDRVFAEDDIDSGAGSKVVTFSPAFKETPAIGIAATMQTGDFYEITNKTRSGFTITFKNSGGTAVDRTFDYVAKGFGREVS